MGKSIFYQSVACFVTPIGIFAGSASWNLDGNGSWTSEANWSQSSGVNMLYPNGKEDVATFPPFKITKPVTIKVDGTIDVTSLIFNTDHKYTLESGKLNVYKLIDVTGECAIKSTLVLQGSVDVNTKGNLTIFGDILGKGGLVKMGSGSLTLYGNDSYEGNTKVESGVLQAGNVNAFSPNSEVVISNTSGVVFDLNHFNNKIASLSGSGNLGGNTNLGKGTLTVGNDKATVYKGKIFGSGGLTKIGSGTLILGCPGSSYSGETYIEDGVLEAGAKNALSPDSAVVLSTHPSAVLNLNGYDNQIFSLNGGGMTGGSVDLGKGRLTLLSDVDSNFSGTISGKGGITKLGKGVLTLSRMHTYSGPTIVAEGTLELTGMIGSQITIKKGATLQGSGKIVGNVVNYGSVKPEKMSVVGNFRQAKGSILEIDVTSESGSLLTSGYFTIEEGVVLNINAEGTYTPGTVYEIVASGCGISGLFANINYPEKFLVKTSSHNITIEMK